MIGALILLALAGGGAGIAIVGFVQNWKKSKRKPPATPTLPTGGI